MVHYMDKQHLVPVRPSLEHRILVRPGLEQRILVRLTLVVEIRRSHSNCNQQHYWKRTNQSIVAVEKKKFFFFFNLRVPSTSWPIIELSETIIIELISLSYWFSGGLIIHFITISFSILIPTKTQNKFFLFQLPKSFSFKISKIWIFLPKIFQILISAPIELSITWIIFDVISIIGWPRPFIALAVYCVTEHQQYANRQRKIYENKRLIIMSHSMKWSGNTFSHSHNLPTKNSKNKDAPRISIIFHNAEATEHSSNYTE